MNCNMYTPNSAIENTCSQIYALENSNYFDNITLQPIALDSDSSSDSLKCILNDLNIGFPEDDQNTIMMGTDNVDKQQAWDATILNSTLIQSNEENVQNYSSCPGKKISLSSRLKIKILILILRSMKNLMHEH